MHNRNKGVVLLSVIIILLTMALIGASLVSFFTSLNLSVRATVDEAKAFYLAEAGIAHAIYMLKHQASAQMNYDEMAQAVSLGEGTYTVKVDINQSFIVSTGEVHDVEKTLQMQYSSL